MYLVICYDVKNQTVDTIDKFDTFEKAKKHIETDVCNVYQQEKILQFSKKFQKIKSGLGKSERSETGGKNGRTSRLDYHGD